MTQQPVKQTYDKKDQWDRIARYVIGGETLQVVYDLKGGFTGLIGIQQAWVMWLSAVPLLLVAALDLWPVARRRMFLAAPVYSLGLVLASTLIFHRTPVLSTYAITPVDVLIAAILATAGGLLTGSMGYYLARRVSPAADDPL
jgi:uncharacterized iron-regulated membrane protein